MVIIGAKGFAKEVLNVCIQNNIPNIAFYDDMTKESPDLLYNQYPILTNTSQIVDYFQNYGNNFTIGIGNPVLRNHVFIKIKELGGNLTSIISTEARIGSYDVSIDNGTIILPGVTISNSVKIGWGTMIYYNSIITHDCQIDNFVEISPNVTLLGRSKVSSFTHIGAGAIILPDVHVGGNVIVGAGAIVTKNIPDNCVVAGIPAQKIKDLKPLNF